MVDDPSTDAFVSLLEQRQQQLRRLERPRVLEGLLPKYFKHYNFSSFVRRLNPYMFSQKISVEMPIVVTVIAISARCLDYSMCPSYLAQGYSLLWHLYTLTLFLPSIRPSPSKLDETLGFIDNRFGMGCHACNCVRQLSSFHLKWSTRTSIISVDCCRTAEEMSLFLPWLLRVFFSTCFWPFFCLSAAFMLNYCPLNFFEDNQRLKLFKFCNSMSFYELSGDALKKMIGNDTFHVSQEAKYKEKKEAKHGKR
ncbi:hypothetical protein EV1_046783 [Malus domestica]